MMRRPILPSSTIIIVLIARYMIACSCHVSGFAINRIRPNYSQLVKPRTQMLVVKKIGRTAEDHFDHKSPSSLRFKTPKNKISKEGSLRKKPRKLLLAIALSVSIFVRGRIQPVYAAGAKAKSEAITEPKPKGFSKNAAPIIATVGGVVLAKKMLRKEGNKESGDEDVTTNKLRRDLSRMLQEQEEKRRSTTEMARREAEARKKSDAVDESTRLKKKEEERIAAEQAARMKKEEEEHLAAEQAARLKKEEEERIAAEEAARLKKEEEELIAAEQVARLKKEEEERLATEEAARLKKEEEERLTTEETARLKKEEEGRVAAEKAARLKKEEEESQIQAAALDNDSKYLAIEDPSERAYQILIDLGMVQVTPDPDDPSYDSSKDDEYVL